MPLDKLFPPAIRLDEEKLEFGEVEVGHPTQATVTVRNEGQGPLKVTAIRSNLPDISVSQEAFTIPVGGTLTVAITLTLQSEGAFEGELEVISDDPSRETVRIPLSGIAKVRPADPRVDFDGNGRVDFSDFVEFAQIFGKEEGDADFDATYDLDESGSVDFGDFVIFAQNFGKKVGD